MIEKDGIKIAENKEEAFWSTYRKNCENNIEADKHDLIIQEELIKFCDKMLKK